MAQRRTDEQISQGILDELRSTDYACSSLERLSGGLANYVFRGTLTAPLPDGTKEVAVKHAESSLARLPKWKLPIARCVRLVFVFEPLVWLQSTWYHAYGLRRFQLVLWSDG